MNRISKLALAAASAIVALTSAAAALDSANGSTVVELFDVADVAARTQYPGAFSGAAWGNLTTLHFGSRGTSHAEQSNDLAGCGDDIYVVVRGFYDELDRVYTGLVRFDGTQFHHVHQSVNVRVQPGPITSSIGDEVRGVVVSLVTTGRLTAGHPVLTRQHKTVVDQVDLQLVSIDPATGDETLVYSWTTAALAPEAIVAFDGDGDIYVLEAGLPEIGGTADDGETIRKLTWKETAYEETRLGSGRHSGGVLVGPDGFVYAFDAADHWKVLTSPYPDHQILRIDPDTGTSAVWARADGRSFIFDWKWSDDGRLWLGMRSSGRKAVSYVAEATPDVEASTSTRISNSGNDPDSIGTGSGGSIVVMERPFEPTGAVYILSPESSGGSGGGGGKGGGKGRK